MDDMKNIEAWELLKEGERVAKQNDRTGRFYRTYSQNNIYQLKPTSHSSSEIVGILTPEEFLQIENVDFVLVDD